MISALSHLKAQAVHQPSNRHLSHQFLQVACQVHQVFHLLSPAVHQPLPTAARHVTWCHVGTANKDALTLLADTKVNLTSQTSQTGMGAVRTTASRIMGNSHNIAEPRAALLAIPHNRSVGVLGILTSGLSMAHHSTARSLTSKKQESSSCSSQL